MINRRNKMKYKLTKEVYRKDLKIPNNWRLIEDYELLKLLRKDKEIRKLLIDDYLWCNTMNGTRAGWLGDFGDVSRFDAVGGDVGSHFSLRGVLVVINRRNKMKYCENCGHELNKTIKIEELGIEIQDKVTQHNTSFNDLKINKPWRLLVIEEAIYVANNYAEELDLYSGNNNFWIKQPFKKNEKNKWVAGLDYVGGGLHVVGGNNMDDHVRSRGVLLCRDLNDE